MDIEILYTVLSTIMAILLYQFILLIGFILIMVVKYGVLGRAILVEPPHRSCLWRFNYNTTINTKDDDLNCGGYDYQWRVQKGRCGVCGDRYGDIQEHDDGGKYASGIIVRSYKDGYYINVTFEVSSNYLGYVEFRMCPRNHTSVPLTQGCFDRYPLWIDEAHGTRYYIGSRGGIYDIHVRLPGGVVCKKCVLQWKYKTGYRYNGEDTCKCLGCGEQEQYINCADIEVYPLGGWPVTEQTIVSPQFPVFAELSQFSPAPSVATTTLPSSIVDHTPRRVQQELATPVWSIPETIFFALTRRFGFTRPPETVKQIQVTTTRPPLISSLTEPITSKVSRDVTTAPPFIHIPEPQRPLDIVNITEGQENVTFLANGEKMVFTVPKIGKLNTSVPMKPIELGHVTPRPPVGLHSTVPNTQFVSVSNILSRFFPEYTPPFMFTLRDRGLSPLMFYPGCNVNSDEFRCVARGIYKQSPGINKWCEVNCKMNNCVHFMCDCSCEDKFSPRISRCRAVNKFRRVEGMDQWCAANCKVGYCPSAMCSIPHCINSNGEI